MKKSELIINQLHKLFLLLSKNLTLLFVILFGIPIVSVSQPGSLDLSFNPGGTGWGLVYASALQSDGKIIIGGNITIYNGTSINRIARLNTDGSLDNSFVVGSGVDDVVYDIVIQPDGKIIVAGEFTSYNGLGTNFIARLNADGSLDSSFDIGSGPNDRIRSVSLQSDGKIVIGGYFTSYNDTNRKNIARINTDGSLDTSFNPGWGPNNAILATEIQPDGKILIGGFFSEFDFTSRNRIARLNQNGSLDTSFDPGSGANISLSGIAVQPDGKIILGGFFSIFNGEIANRLVRLNSDGTIDDTFDTGAGVTGNFVRSVDLLSDGKMIISGDFSAYNGTSRNYIARINADGSLDTSFDPGSGANNWIATTSFQSDGKIVIGGLFTSYDGNTVTSVARIFNEIPDCEVSVIIESTGWGDETVWELTDSEGVIVLSGGPYGIDYSDTQVLIGADNGPYSLFISTIGIEGDNVANYSVILDDVVIASGTVGANSSEIIGSLATICAPPPLNFCCDNPLPGPGCPQYPDCEDVVCSLDVLCCNVEWDISCASSAFSLCGIPECTSATCASPTFTTHATPDCFSGTYDLTLDIGNNGNAQFYEVFVGLPACDEAQDSAGFSDDPACESAICITDPFCCDNVWDTLCASIASSEPECTACLAPQVIYVGSFASGSTGIVIGTFPINEAVEIDVLHGWGTACNQSFSTGPADVCGCTDASAVNFDPEADLDDGSCVFPPANDDCASAQPLTVTAWPAVSNTMGTLTGAFGSGWGACAGVDGPDVFYTFNAETTNHYIINLNAFGGFVGVAELYDGCSGTLIECFEPAPNCVVPQSTPGFPSDPTCEAAVCGDDPFCCTDEWDSFCATAAFDVFTTECAGCMGGAPAFPAIALDLPAGDYTLRVRNLNGQIILDNNGNFLINVQSFPQAKVQDNPANFMYACNTTDRQLEEIVGASPQTGQLAGILDYEWEIHRIGGGFSNTWQRGGPNYSTKLTWLSMEYGETYNVYVRLLINIPGVGPVWGVHQVLGGLNPEDAGASTCTIATSSSVTQTEVRPQYTPTNLQGNAYAMCNVAVAFSVADAENYEWEFNDGINPPVYYERGVGNPSVKLSWVNCLKPNTTYQVRVRANVDGQWGVFGNAQPMAMAPTANTALRANMCGTTRGLFQWLLPNPVCIADSYEYRLTNTMTGDVHTSLSTVLSGGVKLDSFSPELVPGAEYVVEVKATQCGEEGDYSSTCNITIAGPQAQGDETPAVRTMAGNSATLYPSPNAGTEVRVELSGLGDGNHEVMIQIYDVYGKLIQTEGFGHAGSDMSRLVRFDGNLAMGMYMVQFVVDGERFTTERLVVK